MVPTNTAVRMIVVCAIAALAVGSLAMADTSVVTQWTMPEDSSIVSMNATATFTGSAYHYQYVLAFTPGNTNRRLTTFSVENIPHMEWTNATAVWTPTDSYNHYSSVPVWDVNSTSQNSILWRASPTVPWGYTITFGFDSIYSPRLADTTIAGSGYSTASLVSQGGGTLGLELPEPGSIAMLAGLIGSAVLGITKRRR